MDEAAFEVAIDGGVLRGHRGGTGASALLLHGGPAIPDYMGDCAEALDGLFSTIRYTQRGVPPSAAGPPYTIESHASDALAVLDSLGIDRAWAVGHSWGGHLALHLGHLHADRLLGLLLIDPLGADPTVFADLDANLRRGLTEDERHRVDDIEDGRRDGDVSEADLVERYRLLWPQYFARREEAFASPARVGVQCSIETNRSIGAHFQAETLVFGLPGLSLPALFVHGQQDPLPLASTERTAALIQDARVEAIPGCGHFPWHERRAAFRQAVERLFADVDA
jgi:pimeloyl-ACP methyl ester carboxylesterase